MIATKSLQRRLDHLEERSSIEPDLIGMTLSALSDDELLLLQEIAALHQSGIDEQKIVGMMGDRYQEAQQAIARFHAEYNRIAEKVTRPMNDKAVEY